MAFPRLDQITINGWQLTIGVLGLSGVWLGRVLAGERKFGKLEQSVSDLKDTLDAHILAESNFQDRLDKKLEHLNNRIDDVFKLHQ